MGLFNINRWDYPENSQPYLPSDSIYAYVPTPVQSANSC